jgi:hypothetical protein
MGTFIGTKSLMATPMTKGDYNRYRGWEMPSNEEASEQGYLVEYLDGGQANHIGHIGYISWSPKEVFEKSYQQSGNLSFGHALLALEQGKCVARAGWNGKGMFVYMVPANSYPAQTGAAKAHFGENALVPYAAYLALKGVNDVVSTWVPSINDCLAKDWSIVEPAADNLKL